MTDKPKRLNILGALGDFTILVLLIAGAGFGGYYIGLNQRLAPVQYVWPGTPGAVPIDQILGPQAATATVGGGDSKASAATPGATPAPSTATPAVAAKPATAAATAAQNAKRKTKFWLCSTGADDYVGYSITAKINGVAVDNFFSAGKTIDISKHVKKGSNKLELECKNLGDDYNNHKDDQNASKAVLTVQLVSGPSVRDDYPQSAVLFTVKRNASETQDFNEEKTFESKE
ncbi:hypothetical protein KF728_04190 [Candidatus Obscuribacterales bacterium]|nr:hypothetical protein [Candidatus Obscuribacterales bacterium]MBX3149335.1 hypothetical protein [Candidatus Obscuribacterales bacterium]